MDKLMTLLLPAVIGAVTAVFAAYLGVKYSLKGIDFSKRIEELCEIIGQLEELSCEYWKGGIEPSKEKDIEQYMIGLKTKIRLLIDYLDQEYNYFSKDSISKLSIEFFNFCTGGPFGSSDRPKDPTKQRKILIIGEKLKIELMRTRTKLY